MGEGGFGSVKLGQHRKTKQFAAIKFIKNTLSIKFLKKNQLPQFFLLFYFFFFFFFLLASIDEINMVFQEANALKALNHPNIVQIYEFHTFKNMQSAFVMEYLEGGELGDYLRRNNCAIGETKAQCFFR